MHCLNCHQELPNDACYCPACGKVIRADEWEICQIVREDTVQGFSFWADAENDSGRFRAGETIHVNVRFKVDRGIGTAAAVELHESLVKQLERDNWEMIGRREHWWETIFRRRSQGS